MIKCTECNKKYPESDVTVFNSEYIICNKCWLDKINKGIKNRERCDTEKKIRNSIFKC